MNTELKQAIDQASEAVEQLKKSEVGGSVHTEALRKSHVKEYTRTTASGASVQVKEHDDKRQAHPNIIGTASNRDNTMPAATHTFTHDGKKYSSTGKSGTSMHDGRPVREFEHEKTGHRVWMDNDANVHADSKEEADKHHKRGMYADHTAEDAKAEYDGKRKEADKATATADKHQAGMDWSKPDTKKLQELHHAAAKKHIDAMEAAHQAGDGESMRHHFHKASMHLGAAGSAGTFHRKDAADNAKAQTAMASHISAVAAKHKGEKTAHDLDHGSSIHLLAMEQHQRASAAHSAHHNSVYGTPEADEANNKAEGHQSAAREHGKSVQHFSGIAIKASDHAYNIGKAADKSKNPEDHKEAAALHRHAASLDYDSEGRAAHEAKAAEHDKKANATDKPAEKKQSASEVLEEAGLKHKPKDGYKPELDPYQDHYGSVPHTTIHQHLKDAGYKYIGKGADWHTYSRSSQAGADRITLHSEGKTIKRATRYSGPHRD